MTRSLLIAILILIEIPLTSFCQDAKIDNTDGLYELEVEGVYEYGSSYLVRLVRVNKPKSLAMGMYIGGCEADGIARSISGVDFTRPLTYDVFNSIFELTSLEVEYLLISELKGGTYYGILVINDNGKKVEIDVRPSDGINIALKTKSKIYTNKVVWEEAKEKLN